jgi:tRNA(Ile)-lysidine synthase
MRGALPPDDGLWQHPVIGALRDTLTQTFEPQHGFVVACSGGRDSLLLAALLHRLCPARVRVVHVDHGLHVSSSLWAQHVQDWCAAQSLPCVVRRVQVAAGNLEAAARQARQAALRAELAPHDVLVLGHHQQDQAETLFMRACQGAGVVGLAAMRSHDVWHGHLRWRPWLTVSRSQITQLADHMGLAYIDDPANAALRFDRVWLRQVLWPALTQRWPSAAVGMQRTAHLMQDAADILAEVAAQDGVLCHLAGATCPDTLNVSAVCQLSAPRQRLLLSRWMQGDSPYAPPLSRVEAVRTLLNARRDSDARVDWSDWQIRVYRQGLYRLPRQLPVAQDQPLLLDADQCVDLPSGRWQWCGAGVPHTWTLRARNGGERLHLSGRIGHWPLKKLLQSSGLPPWQRPAVHLLYAADDLLGVLTPLGFWPTVWGQPALSTDCWIRLSEGVLHP